MMEKERELIRQLLEVHAIVSMHNNSLNLQDLIDQSKGMEKIGNVTDIEESKRQLNEEVQASVKEKVEEVSGDAAGGEHGAGWGDQWEWWSAESAASLKAVVEVAREFSLSKISL